MSNPLWPDPANLPFKIFGAPGEASTTMPGFSQGLAGGMDLVKKFWGNLPGGSALPGFLVPTVDLAELDKRVSDLRAAESWVEVNLNMLRATIQGLEVQRNTIAAIQSLSAMADGVMAGNAAPPAAAGTASADAAPSGLPPGWPAMPPPAPQATPPEAPVEVAPPVAAAPGPGAETDPAVSLATSNWLGLMQQQFMKVAQAAIAPPLPQDASKPATRAPGRKRTARAASAKTARNAKRRTPSAG